MPPDPDDIASDAVTLLKSAGFQAEWTDLEADSERGADGYAWPLVSGEIEVTITPKYATRIRAQITIVAAESALDVVAQVADALNDAAGHAQEKLSALHRERQVDAVIAKLDAFVDALRA